MRLHNMHIIKKARPMKKKKMCTTSAPRQEAQTMKAAQIVPDCIREYTKYNNSKYTMNMDCILPNLSFQCRFLKTRPLPLICIWKRFTTFPRIDDPRPVRMEHQPFPWRTFQIEKPRHVFIVAYYQILPRWAHQGG